MTVIFNVNRAKNSSVSNPKFPSPILRDLGTRWLKMRLCSTTTHTRRMPDASSGISPCAASHTSNVYDDVRNWCAMYCFPDSQAEKKKDQSQNQPPVMPRPDAARLGIGYRRIPILAISRDIYLDTRLQLQKLEKLDTRQRRDWAPPRPSTAP